MSPVKMPRCHLTKVGTNYGPKQGQKALAASQTECVYACVPPQLRACIRAVGGWAGGRVCGCGRGACGCVGAWVCGCGCVV